MAERLAYLEAVVGADVTQFRKGMRDIRNEVGFLSETVRGLSGLGRSLTFAFTTPVLALGTASIGVASDFQASMANINAIAQFTGDEIDALGQRTLEFGARTRQGANAAADALYTVFSAGLTDTEAAFTAMEVATFTAEAGLADLTTTTETLVATMLAYGDTSEAAMWDASDAITQMVAVGVGEMEEFATAIGSVIPTAAAAGMGLDELAADMAFLTQRGLTASRASTSLNAAIEQLVNPTQAMQAAFRELGAGGLDDLVEQFGSVNGAMQAVIETADGDTTQLFQMFNSRQARRAVGLFATDIEGWEQALDDFYGSIDGATMRAWEQQMTSFAASWDLLTSAVEAAGIAIGQTLFPVLQPFVDAITDLILGVVDTSPELLGMAAAFTTVAAAIPPLIWLVASLISPFGVLAGAVAAVGVAFATDFAGIATHVQTTVDAIMVHLQPMIDIMNDFWDTIFPEAPETWDFTDSVTPATVSASDIITVDAPSSLWDIFVEQGYSEFMSWDAFMAAATEGGWAGGVIDVGDTITLEGEPTTDFTYPDMGAVNFVPEDAELFADDRTIWERIADGAEEAIPLIQEQLDLLWDVFSGWLDEKGSDVIDGIAGWFTNFDSQAIYSAFTALLQGDLETAINAIFPNLGTQVANTIGNWDLSTAFPQISASLTTLMTSVGDWFLTDAVPLLAQSAGFLAGRIGVLLYNAIQAGIGWVTSGGTDGIGEYVEEGIVDPFTTGMEQATAGTEFGGFISEMETMFTDIGDAITDLADTLDLDVTWTVLEDIGDAIGYFMDTIGEADSTGLITLLQLIILLGGGLFSASINLINSVGSSFADAIRAMGDGIAYFMDAMTLATEGDWLGAFSSLGGAFLNLAFALLQIPAGIFDWFINGINTLLGTDIGSLSDWLAQLQQDMASFGDDYDPTVPITVNPQFNYGQDFFTDANLTATEGTEIIMSSDLPVLLEMANVQLDFGDWAWDSDVIYGLEVPEEIVWDESQIALAAELTSMRFSADPETMMMGAEIEAALMEGMSAEDAIVFQQLLALEAPVIVTPSGVTYQLTDAGYVVVETGDTPITTDGDVDATTTGTTTITPEGDVEINSDTPVTVPTVDLSTTSTAFAQDFAEGGDAQSIIDEQLIPLQEAWNLMFAEDGTMAVNFATFTAGVSTGWTDIGTSINDTIAIINDDLPVAVTTMQTQLTTAQTDIGLFEDAASDAKDEVNGLKNAIEALFDMEGTLNVEITVTGSMGDVNGSHKAGLKRVPYDGYVAELHKGERVLTKDEADDYNTPVPNNITTSNVRGSSKGETTNNITINGRQTVDEIVRELNRRGIRLK